MSTLATILAREFKFVASRTSILSGARADITICALVAASRSANPQHCVPRIHIRPLRLQLISTMVSTRSASKNTIPGDSGVSGLAEQKPLITPKAAPHTFPDATFSRALTTKTGKRMPQTISHRGYKAKFPENSMLAFREAVKAGTHALETDIHLTKDGEVILSHDPSLKRCFGKDEKIIDVTWDTLSTYRTVMAPHEPLPRLEEFLDYLAQPEQAHLWTLLDIKLNNNADDVMRLISKIVHKVKPAKGRPWNERVVLGIWATNYIPLCDKYLPGFPISCIAFSPQYARAFHSIPNVSFNMLYGTLFGPIGSLFTRKTKRLDRAMYAWTVNDEKMMQWAIRKKLDGVITDDPKLFLETCDNYNEKATAPKFSWQDIWSIVKLQVLVISFYFYFRIRVGRKIDPRYKQRTKTR